MKKFATNTLWLSVIMTLLIISSDKQDEYQEKVISTNSNLLETVSK